MVVNEISTPSLREIRKKALWINSVLWDVILIKSALLYAEAGSPAAYLFGSRAISEGCRGEKTVYDKWYNVHNEQEVMWQEGKPAGYISTGKPTCTTHLPEKHCTVIAWQQLAHKVEEVGESEKWCWQLRKSKVLVVQSDKCDCSPQ